MILKKKLMTSGDIIRKWRVFLKPLKNRAAFSFGKNEVKYKKIKYDIKKRF